MQIKHLLVAVLGLTTLSALAQPKINSPLSRLGIGDYHYYSAHHLNMMGGLYAGYADVSLPNTYNPAGIGYLQTTAYDLGLTVGKSYIDLESGTGEYNQGNLEHLTLAFPLQNTISEVLERKDRKYSWNMGFDLRSKTRVGYNVEVIDSTVELGEVLRTYEGGGGTYDLGWINAVRYKELSVGLDIGIFFGNINQSRTVVFNDHLDAARDYYDDAINLNGFRYKLGAQYRFLLNEKEENEDRRRYLVVGAYGHHAQSFKTDASQLYYGYRPISQIRDTLVDESGVEGSGKLPGTIGLGATYQPDLRWMVGVNAEFSNWENFESDDFSEGGFTQGMNVGAGFSFVPDKNAFGRYFKRVGYKGGVQWIKDGRTFNGEDVQILKATAGMSLPFYFLRQISHVHLGLEYKRTTADFISENYFGLQLSATFNDNSWFLKRKFN